jgi:hypothetical protein
VSRRLAAPIVGRDGMCGVMSPNYTQPTDTFDTAELELPPPGNPPGAGLEPGRPSWEPEEGDFN